MKDLKKASTSPLTSSAANLGFAYIRSSSVHVRCTRTTRSRAICTDSTCCLQMGGFCDTPLRDGGERNSLFKLSSCFRLVLFSQQLAGEHTGIQKSVTSTWCSYCVPGCLAT